MREPKPFQTSTFSCLQLSNKAQMADRGAHAFLPSQKWQIGEYSQPEPPNGLMREPKVLLHRKIAILAL